MKVSMPVPLSYSLATLLDELVHLLFNGPI